MAGFEVGTLLAYMYASRGINFKQGLDKNFSGKKKKIHVKYAVHYRK